MGHGLPDFGATSGKVTTYQLTDMAELAARLGSLVTFDRRGEVILLESFEGGRARWGDDTVGVGGDVDLSLLAAKTGRVSARLVSGSTSDMMAQLTLGMPLPVLSRLGVEASFSLDSDVTYVGLRASLHKGTSLARYWFRLDVSNGLLEILDVDTVWATVASGLRFYGGVTLWHTLKLVFDGGGDSYCRCLFDDTGVDLSGYDANVIDDTDAPYGYWAVQQIGSPAVNAVAYVDDIIITQNEP